MPNAVPAGKSSRQSSALDRADVSWSRRRVLADHRRDDRVPRDASCRREGAYPYGELRPRAEKPHEDLPEGLSILHEQDGGLHDDAWYINQWQNGDADVLLSPALTDGVDLPDDTCRWQALLKVPYPNPTDARVDARLKEPDGDQWYYETTAQSIIQAVGRGVRHVEDYCTFYVLDESYFDVRRKASFPE